MVKMMMILLLLVDLLFEVHEHTLCLVLSLLLLSCGCLLLSCFSDDYSLVNRSQLLEARDFGSVALVVVGLGSLAVHVHPLDLEDTSGFSIHAVSQSCRASIIKRTAHVEELLVVLIQLSSPSIFRPHPI